MEDSFIIYEGVVVPESVLLKREREDPYGGVEGLDDEELAEADELASLRRQSGEPEGRK